MRDVVTFLALWIGYTILILVALAIPIALVKQLRAWLALTVRRRKPGGYWYPAIEPPTHHNCRCDLIAYNPIEEHLHPLQHPTVNVDAASEDEAWATIARRPA